MLAKRSFDVALSLAALLLFLPFGVVIALVLLGTGEGHVFYRQIRVGKDGQPFHLLKFATMLAASASMPNGTITVKNDSRVLPVGRLLRKTKLNEVPQLWNVLTGEMSLVGPRPLTPETYAYIPDSCKEELISLKPGLTGIGSLVFRDEESIIENSGQDYHAFYREVVGPYKGQLEVWYKTHSSCWQDIKILIATAWVVLRPRSPIVGILFPALPKCPHISG